MDTATFLQLVQESLDSLPETFAQRLWNLEIEVQPEPSRREIKELGLGPDDTLFGLYTGVPLTERGANLSGVVPDVITIYQGPIERECDGDEACVRREVRDTVLHEIAHYFGIDDDRLEELNRA